MKKLTMIFFLGFIFLIMANIKAAEDECFNCHDTVVGDDPSALFKNDIHHKKGIPCSGCHGGNSTTDDMDAAMNKDAGFIGVPKGNQISERCANCHSNPETMKKYGADIPTNQMALLSKSVHGQLSINGQDRIVQCITCHNAHGIVEVTNPKSPVYPLNLPNTCAKCHSNACVIIILLCQLISLISIGQVFMGLKMLRGILRWQNVQTAMEVMVFFQLKMPIQVYT